MIRNKEIRALRPVGRPGSVSFKEHLKPMADTTKPDVGLEIINILKFLGLMALALTALVAMYYLLPLVLLLAIPAVITFKLTNEEELC